jgi:hypothetical protein
VGIVPSSSATAVARTKRSPTGCRRQPRARTALARSATQLWTWRRPSDRHAGVLDTDLLVYPVEGYALSIGVRAAISCPRFADAAFSVGDGNSRITVHIDY